MKAVVPSLSPRHVMVIFGAGASRDSIADADNRAVLIGNAWQRQNRVSDEAVYERLDWRPPRTSELFDERARFQRAIANHPAVGVLIDGKLRGLDAKANSVEAVLDTLSGEARESPALRRQLASLRFYLREVLWQRGDNWRTRSLRRRPTTTARSSASSAGKRGGRRRAARRGSRWSASTTT